MTVLVTGGAGFIGSALVRSLVSQSHRVRVLDDLSTGLVENLRDTDEVELELGDVRDPDEVRSAVTGSDVVWHLAALPSVARSVVDPATTSEVNVGGTLNVLTAARDLGVRRVVYASSSSVYGQGRLPLREDLAPAPISPYAASKLAAEGYCRAFAHVFGLETVVLRLFNVFGPRQDPASDYARVVPAFISRMLGGRPPVIFGDGHQTRDFTYVEDAVRALVLAASAGDEAVGQPINVGCGRPTSVLRVLEMLVGLLDVRLPPEFAAPRTGDVRHTQADLSRARWALGYRPETSLEEGLAETVRWFTAADESHEAIPERASADGDGHDGEGLTPLEEKQIVGHLRSLGYVD